MTLSGLGLLTMSKFPRGDVSLLYLFFFKTFVPVLFRTFGLPPHFLPSKLSFPLDYFTTQHPDFASFLAVSITDRPVNRSIHAYALTQLNVFALRGFIFLDIHQKNKEGVRAIRAIKYKKKNWKIYLRTGTFGAEVQKSNIRVKRWHSKCKKSELDWKTKLLFK